MKNTPNRKELGEAIRRIRVKELKMSLTQFAELTMTSRSTLQRIEAGQADFGLRSIQAIESKTQTPFYILMSHIHNRLIFSSFMLKKMNQCQKRQVRQ